MTGFKTHEGLITRPYVKVEGVDTNDFDLIKQAKSITVMATPDGDPLVHLYPQEDGSVDILMAQGARLSTDPKSPGIFKVSISDKTLIADDTTHIEFVKRFVTVLCDNSYPYKVYHRVMSCFGSCRLTSSFIASGVSVGDKGKAHETLTKLAYKIRGEYRPMYWDTWVLMPQETISDAAVVIYRPAD